MSGTISTISPISLSSQSSNSFSEKKMIPIDKISPAIAFSDAELACFHAVKYILHTHKSLSENDITYSANFISSFYALRENVLTDDQLVMFLVYADKSGICRFALIFNEELDTAIKNKDRTGLKRLLLGPKEMFIELYDNTFLSNEDRDFILRLIARESFAMMLALGLLKKNSESFTANVVTITTKCYDEVCIQDSKLLEDDPERAVMSKHEKPPESVFTVDKPKSSRTPSVYCFNTLDLIKAVTETVPINPKTGEPFSDYSLKVIRDRFRKEINMYRRYRQIKYVK